MSGGKAVFAPVGLRKSMGWLLKLGTRWGFLAWKITKSDGSGTGVVARLGILSGLGMVGVLIALAGISLETREFFLMDLTTGVALGTRYWEATALEGISLVLTGQGLDGGGDSFR